MFMNLKELSNENSQAKPAVSAEGSQLQIPQAKSYLSKGGILPKILNPK